MINGKQLFKHISHRKNSGFEYFNIVFKIIHKISKVIILVKFYIHD